jgi:hemerythrin-like domain-containing protein
MDVHQKLDALFGEVTEAAAAGVDPRTLGELWSRFDAAVRAHLEMEEQHLFPAVADEHSVEVRALGFEHQRIRAMLDAMDVEMDLHMARDPAIEALIETLRAHAAREDRGLYRWAGRAMGVRDRLAVRHHIEVAPL